MSKVGVLLINLGTPDAADAKAVRRYLKQFLSDRRVVEIPPIAWQPILRGHHPHHQAEEIGRGLSTGLDRAGLAACRDHPARRRRRWRARSARR